MSVVSRQRYLIPLLNGNTINVLVEEQSNPALYKYAAVLDHWHEGCTFGTGITLEQAMQELAELLNVMLPADWRKYESGVRAAA